MPTLSELSPKFFHSKDISGKEFNEAAVRKEQAEKGVVEMEQLIALQENKILQLKESHGRMKVQLPPTDVNGQPNAETVYRLEEAQNKINLAEIEMQRIKYNKKVFGANAKAQEKLMEDISGRKHWSSGEGGMLDGALNKLWDDWFGDEEEQKGGGRRKQSTRGKKDPTLTHSSGAPQGNSR